MGYSGDRGKLNHEKNWFQKSHVRLPSFNKQIVSSNVLKKLSIDTVLIKLKNIIEH
jgi:hypothetical protein